MFKKPSLMLRITVAKIFGLVVGIGWAIMLTAMPQAGIFDLLGYLLWWVTLGAMVGAFGVIDWLPVLNRRFTWWLRGPWIAGWLGLVAVMLAYGDMAALLQSYFQGFHLFNSPWWFVAACALFGLVCDLIATIAAGDGKETVQML
ncbi:DUF4175 domain-containing protein [Oceanomicrobium pacificus]|uniref:Uncharacterized protein n=1 Tax=Oceanomicrobium pacificus TaxID=2692916 RepID=A0A6B0TYV0_9RHOB|nr:DUF4175 domain-containing protein [Oceanomicrobium pacificus]MXU66193.1 hypothetical protein [Oceanomicrobium pacificus]